MTFASITRAAAVCCTLFASVQVSADAPTQRPGPGHDHGGPRKPPQEAYSACADHSEGDACTVQLGEHSIDGSCVADREDSSKLFCRPSRPPGPPPEAFTACENKSEGDDCTVTARDGNAGPSGTCERGPGDKLICRPARHE